MTTITSLGVGSGLDAETIITKLVAAESAPMTAIKTKQAKVNAQISAFGKIKSLLDAVATAVSKMKTADTLASAKATSSDSSFLTATTTSTAGIGSYDIQVTQVATANKVISAGITGSGTDTGVNTIVGAGDITLSVAGGSTTTISMGASSTLGDLRDAINKSEAGVSASILNTTAGAQLVLTASETGKAISYDFSGLTDAPSALRDPFSTITDAQSAEYTIDGQSVTSTSNTDSTTIPGVTLNLIKANTTDNPTTTLTVTRSSDAITTAVNNFVSAYNALNTEIAADTAYDATNKRGSILTGDSTLRNIQNQIRSIISSSQSGVTGSYSSFSELGITFQKDGSLAVDSTKLENAINTDQDSTISVLTTYSSALYTQISPISETGGILAQKTDSLNNTVKSYDKDIVRWQERLSTIEARYRKQFSLLDTISSQMSSTSSYLTQMSAQLSANNK